MSPLPLISHHLFVAAINPQHRDAPAERSSAEPASGSNAIALELLDFNEPLPEIPPRTLRGSPSHGRH